MSVPTEEEFRQTGYTANAINFPMSDAALYKLCEFNGISLEQAPKTWRYAPNEAVRQFWEKKAAP